MPVLLGLQCLGVHLRRRDPVERRVLELAGRALADLARVLATEAELGIEEVLDVFSEAAPAPDDRTRNLPAAKADLSVALEHAQELAAVIQDLAAGARPDHRSSIDFAAGAAGCLLAAVQKAAAFPPDPSPSHPAQLPDAAAARS
jgi:hypothetical protein